MVSASPSDVPPGVGGQVADGESGAIEQGTAPNLDRLQIDRLQMQTVVATDLGWAITSRSADRFLQDRGRPGWLRTLQPRFGEHGRGFAIPTIDVPAYGASAEHGRPTFAEGFANSYMPLSFAAISDGAGQEAGMFRWAIDTVKVGPTGALSIIASVRLGDGLGPVSSPDVVESYHLFRLDLRRQLPDVLRSFALLWNSRVPEYELSVSAVDDLVTNLEFYDLVDFDFSVNSRRVAPKDIYEGSFPDALVALAGLTRMSQVMATYSPKKVALTLQALDMGSRRDELWIANVERLTRHHPEHMQDIAKRLFWTDICEATEIILQQSATIEYMAAWVRGIRAEFLDQLADDSDIVHRHELMRSLLGRLAWASDLYTDAIAVYHGTGSSFFRSVTAAVSSLRLDDGRRKQVAESIDRLLAMAQAVFGERSAATSGQMALAGQRLERKAKNATVAAAVLAAAALFVGGVQVWLGSRQEDSGPVVCVVRGGDDGSVVCTPGASVPP